MKPHPVTLNPLGSLALSALSSVLCLGPLAAATFDSGSTGAYGPMNITNNTTLDLPPDGIFHCTTITVAAGATLTFNRNPLNTPVYLLATGDVVVNGTIDVSATGQAGGPGGFDGGLGGSVYEGMQQGSDGCGPGAGKNIGADYDGAGMFAARYGNLLLSPLVGGSGGAGADGSPGGDGGGGGGAILVASNTRIQVEGSVVANARNWGVFHWGSGGGVRLVAPVVAGSGSIEANSPDYGPSRGRIRIDCTDNQAYRSLNVNGLTSRGSRMIVFPAVIPALDIIEVAGNPIPVGTNAPALFELPVGAPTNQTVKIQARNFTGDVPIRVVVTPEHGSAGAFDATILQSSGNPPFASVPVIIPAGSVCQIHAWTR